MIILDSIKKLNNTVKTNRYIAMTLLFLLSISLSLGLNQLIYLLDIVKFSEGFEKATDVFNSLNEVELLINAGVLAPILEELIFRGVIYWLIKRFLGVKSAIIISAICFGLYHMNIIQFIYAFVFGLIFAMAVEWYGGLVSSISMHMTANIFALYMYDVDYLNTRLGMIISCAAGLILSLILSIILFADKLHSDKLRSSELRGD